MVVRARTLARRGRAGSCAAVAVLAIAFLLEPALRGEEPIALTLPDAVRLALAQSPEIVAAAERVEEAHLGVRLAQSAFTPKVTPALRGAVGDRTLSNQSYGLTAEQAFMSGTRVRGSLTSQSSRNQLGTYYFNDTTVSITQPILRKPSASAAVSALRAAEYRVAIADQGRRAVEQETIVSVAAAYYRLLTHHASIEIASRSLERSRQLAEASEARQRAGRVSRLDVLRAQQLVAEGEVHLVHAEAAVADSLDELRVLLMLPLDRAVTYARELRLPPPAVLPADPVAAALTQRADVAAAEQSVREADRELAAARAMLRPQVEVGMAVTRQTVSDEIVDSFGLRDFRVAAIAAFTMPFDQTPEQTQFRTAAIARGRRLRELDQLRATVRQQVQRAIRQQERATKTAALAETAVAISREQIDVARARYELGLSNNLEVVNAELESLQTLTGQSAALAELALARLRLRQALGGLQTSDVR